MSQTIAHRHGTHVHIPLAPLIALVVAAIIAAAVLILINQPMSTTTSTETTVGAATMALPASVHHPETVAMRRHMIEQAQARVQARAHAPALTAAKWRILHNHLQGTTTNASSVGTLAAPVLATGAYVQHRLSKFPGRFPGPR